MPINRVRVGERGNRYPGGCDPLSHGHFSGRALASNEAVSPILFIVAQMGQNLYDG